MQFFSVSRFRPFAPRLAFELGFATITAANAAPLFATRHLPLQDLPQHMAAISVLRRLLFGSSLDSWFEPTLSRTQYLLVYALGIPLSVPLGVIDATRVIAALTIVSIPYALRYALRRYGGDERLASLSWPLTWNPQFMLGFLNFLAGVPFALVTLGLFADTKRLTSPRRQALLGLLSLCAFYSHLVPFGVLGLGVLLQLRATEFTQAIRAHSGFSSLVASLARDIRKIFREIFFILPACVAALAWALRTPATDASVRAGGVGVVPHPTWPDPSSLPRELSTVLLDFPGSFDERALVGLGLAFLSAVALCARPRDRDLSQDPKPDIDVSVQDTQSRRAWPLVVIPALFTVAYLLRHSTFDWLWTTAAPAPDTWTKIFSRAAVSTALGCFVALCFVPTRARPSDPSPGIGALAWLPVCCAALYLVTPSSYGWIWPIHTRFAVVSALLLALLIGRRMPSRGGWLPVILCAVVSVSFARDISDRFSQWDASELGDLDTALSHTQPNRALIAIVSASGSSTVPNVPLLHAAAWYQVYGGAIATFSFADFPQSPFRYREGVRRPPKLPPRWEWAPDLDLADPTRAFYDYVLVRRGGHDPALGDPRYRSLYDGRSWRLYERTTRTTSVSSAALPGVSP